MMHIRDIAKVITVLFMMSVAFSPMTLQAQNNDMRDLVQMPLAVDKAVKAGLSARDVEIITRSMRDGRIPPHEFNRTLRDVSYIAAERGPEGVHDIGIYTSGAVKDGLRGQELARSIHTRLQSMGIPAGGPNGQGPSPMAEDYIPAHASDRIRQHQNAPRGDTGRRDEPAAIRNTEQNQRNGTPGVNTRNRMEEQRPGGPDYRGTGQGGAGGRSGDKP